MELKSSRATYHELFTTLSKQMEYLHDYRAEEVSAHPKISFGNTVRETVESVRKKMTVTSPEKRSSCAHAWKKQLANERILSTLNALNQLGENGKGQESVLSQGYAYVQFTEGSQKRDETYYIGLGTSQKVLKYLRWKGRLKRREVTRRVTERWVKDIWKLKRKITDESLENATYQFFLKKYGTPSLLHEWAYSFTESLQKYSHDIDIEIYIGIVAGEFSEDFYKEHMDLLNSLKDELENRANESSVSKNEVIKCVKTCCPWKPRNFLLQLQEALDAEFSKKYFKYERLFAENKDGDNLSPFLKVFRRQHLLEFKKIHDQIHEALDERTQSAKISKENISSALKSVDRRWKAQYINLILQKGLVNMKRKKISVRKFMSNLLSSSPSVQRKSQFQNIVDQNFLLESPFPRLVVQ